MTRSPLRHPFADRGDDSYETAPEATHALLKVERIPPVVREPACGSGAGIVLPLRAHGIQVIATDLVDYDCPDSQARIDFLIEHSAGDALAIVTNPSFKLAVQFVEHAKHLCPLVIMLLPLTFYAAERRASPHLYDELARIHVFIRRLPMMHRRGWQGNRNMSQKDYAWFVWERGHDGATVIDRISWQ